MLILMLTEHSGMTDLLQEHSMPLLEMLQTFSQLQLGNTYFYNALNVGQLHQELN